MSIKTDKEIQGDFLDLVSHSPLATAVNGGIYRSNGTDSYRPRDSKLEDIEVIFTKGFTEQVQKGVITILVYVPDIDPYGNGVWVEDGARTAQLARIAQDWIDVCPERYTSYGITQKDTITAVPLPDIRQHAVSIQLHYDFFE